jgi:hypothetical protein
MKDPPKEEGPTHEVAPSEPASADLNDRQSSVNQRNTVGARKQQFAALCHGAQWTLSVFRLIVQLVDLFNHIH